MVIITVGKICSGKSTWAKDQKDYFVFSIDEIILSLFDECLGPNHEKMVLKIEDYILNKIVELDKLNISCIIDDSFLTVKRRKKVIDFLKNNSIDVKIKYFNIDPIIKKDRLEKRNKINSKSTKRQFIISYQKMCDLDSKFEELTIDEQKYLI